MKLSVIVPAFDCAACPWSCAAVASMIYSPANWPLLWRKGLKS